jgi:hypothetical protein
MASAGPSEQDVRASTALGSLACIALKGIDAHRRMLLAEGLLPLFVRSIAHQGASIAVVQAQSSRTMTNALPRFLHRLEALRPLLETKRTTVTAAAVSSVAPASAANDSSFVSHASVPSHAALSVPLDSSLRAQLDPLLHHWHDGIRSKVAAILCDYAD